MSEVKDTLTTNLSGVKGKDLRTIHNIQGDGNCLYTCLGKDMEMNGAQVRQRIIDKAKVHWQDILEYDNEGE
eukprot:10611143-Heterocapsa_arctica.AAC.1